MAKKKKATATAGTVKQVTLYAEGLPPTQFDPEHAARLLKMENGSWSDQPFDEHKEGESTGNNGENGTSNPSGS